MTTPYECAKIDSVSITIDTLKNPGTFVGICYRYGWFITLFIIYKLEDMRGNFKK